MVRTVRVFVGIQLVRFSREKKEKTVSLCLWAGGGGGGRASIRRFGAVVRSVSGGAFGQAFSFFGARYMPRAGLCVFPPAKECHLGGVIGSGTLVRLVLVIGVAHPRRCSLRKRNGPP